MYKLGILVVCVVGIVCGQDDGPIVSTIYGDIQGYSALDYLDRPYDAFLGVPFREPPVEDRRWSRSVPLEPWEGVRNTSMWGPHCIQDLAILYPVVKFTANESEDCLYLNVFVPGSVDDAIGRNLPVMLFYYGGGYSFGTAEMYPGEELAVVGDVIVVTANYRVGMMGFLTSADDVAPGNWGLWDAKYSMEWTRDNIAAFGGDPNRITILGQSAGASTVVHSMLSPQTSDLFQRGIAISGSAWSGDASNFTLFRLAEKWNCSTETTQAAVDCLREAPDKELDRSMEGAYSVVLDNFIADPFLPQSPDDSWEMGLGSHIDLMTGYTYHDDAGFALGKVLGIPNPNETNDYNIPAEDWFSRWWAAYSVYDNTWEIINTLYDRFPNLNSSDDAIASEANVKVMTDMGFGSGSFYQGEKHAESGGGGTTYSYVFSHRQTFHGGYPQWCNGSHMDDIYSVLGQTFMRYMREELLGEFQPDDEAVSDLLIKYYSNFAYSGDPNQGPHTMDLFWPEYELTARSELLQTATPIIQHHTQEVLDHFNWLMYDFPAMMIPPDGEPGAKQGPQLMLLNQLNTLGLGDDLEDEDYFDY